LAVLKNIRLPDGASPWIEPNCLVGKKAWNRWLIWQKYFKEIKKAAAIESTPPDVALIKSSLADTLFALKVRLKDITKENLIDAMESKFLFRLVNAGVVSPYFIALSPTVAEWVSKKAVD